MALSESILVAFFCMAVVFSVLGVLWFLIRIFSAIIRKLEGTNEKHSS